MENLTYDKIEVPGTHKEVQSVSTKVTMFGTLQKYWFHTRKYFKQISTHFDIRVSTVKHLNTPNVHSLDLILTLG